MIWETYYVKPDTQKTCFNYMSNKAALPRPTTTARHPNSNCNIYDGSAIGTCSINRPTVRWWAHVSC
eukprot:4544032-Amphidinium_carterae.2